MNQINPRKLLNSKWTAVRPEHKEKHFIVSDVTFSEEHEVISCELEAVMTRRTILIDWKTLKDDQTWLPGWK